MYILINEKLWMIWIHRYDIDLSTHFYETTTSGSDHLEKPTGWFMMTLVLRGPTAGIVAYHDTTVVAETDEYTNKTSTPGEGKIYIGRKRTNNDGDEYSSLMADELTLWNRSLTAEEVEMIYQMYQE